MEITLASWPFPVGDERWFGFAFCFLVHQHLLSAPVLRVVCWLMGLGVVGVSCASCLAN
jgi:hypothetical protein